VNKLTNQQLIFFFLISFLSHQAPPGGIQAPTPSPDLTVAAHNLLVDVIKKGKKYRKKDAGISLGLSLCEY